MDGHKHTLHTEKIFTGRGSKQLWYNFIYTITFTRTHVAGLFI